MSPLPTTYVTFPTRESRSQFVCARFAPYLQETVLDVGCYEAPLRKLLKTAKYYGVDIAGNPDMKLDLEKTERLPFDNNSYRCVICIDVLEHIENLHAMFDELVRVSGQYIIVSLPNPWCDSRQAIGRGYGDFAHYGLPLEKPEDRHKWFFNLTDSRNFFTGKAAKFGLEVAEMFVTEKARNGLITFFRKLRYPGIRYQNRYSRTLWVVLKKK